MAKSFACLVIGLLFAAAGCQQPQQVSMVDHLPSPNFNGPAFAERPAPPPVAVAPPPAAPRLRTAPPSSSAGAVPAAWIPNVPRNQWYWIIIHHSATPTGGAEAFGRMHRAKGWDELGYHFVIGNGTDTRDGQIEVGPRWPKQKWGAHDKTPGNQYNEHGIGICLVGNFDVSHPTAAQVRSLERLVTYLMKTYRIPPDRVLGHGETKPTDCPGRYMNVAMIRHACAQMLASDASYQATLPPEPRPGQELLAARR